MRIENLRTESSDGRARVAATVTWENCDRTQHDVYFETDSAFAGALSCNPDAFMIACIIPAMHYGEERVYMDAAICPELREGLMTAMSWLRHWFYRPGEGHVHIEAGTRTGMLNPEKPERAGLFFSGGIDSFATLRMNRLNYPPEHPRYMKDGLLVFGFEQADPEAFEYLRKSLSAAARDAALTFIPVYTNIFLHYRKEDAKNGFDFWTYEFMGAALAAVAHVFVNRLSVASINADYDIPNQRPLSSHPVVDPNFSSSDLRIRHDGITLSRYEKTKLLSEWDVALRHIRVCNHFKRYTQQMLNCGKCEKCVRTMLALEATGALNKSSSFPVNNLTSEYLEAYLELSPTTFPLYGELVGPLADKGRNDLARVIEQKLMQYHKRKRFTDMKAALRMIVKNIINRGNGRSLEIASGS